MDKNRFIALVALLVVTFWYTDHIAKKQRAYKEYQEKKAAAAAPKKEAPHLAVTEETTPDTPSATTPDASHTTKETTSVKEHTPDADTPNAEMTPEEAEDLAQEARQIIITTKEFEAVFSSRGAALKKYTLLNHYRTTEHTEANRQVLLDTMDPNIATLRLSVLGKDVNVNSGEIFQGQSIAARNYRVIKEPTVDENGNMSGELVFEMTTGMLRITKTFTFDIKQPYGFGLQVAFQNLSKTPRPIVWGMDGIGGMVPDSGDKYFGMMQGMVALWNGTNSTIDTHGLKELETTPVNDMRPIAWFGLKNRFFGAFLRVEDPNRTGKTSLSYATIPTTYDAEDTVLQDIMKTHPYTGNSFWRARSVTCAPNTVVEDRFTFYGGPMEDSLLTFDPAFSGAISYTWHWFDGISHILINLLQYMFTVIPNYGVCIILLTILIKTVLHGLTRQAMRGQHEMQKVQPLMAEIKRKYGNDRQKLQQETMRLYREHGISPFKSCLPMLLQIPIFFALYGTFARSFAMRQAAFIPGWIEDLSLPDALYIMPFSLPLIGNTLNLLPVIYVAFQLWHQSMTPKSSDPNVASQQAMMKFMPLVFMFIFYAMPAGLLLYFTVQAAYTLVEHWFLRKQMEGPTSSMATATSESASAGQGFSKKKE